MFGILFLPTLPFGSSYIHTCIRGLHLYQALLKQIYNDSTGILRHQIINSFAERCWTEDKIDSIHLRDMFLEEVDANSFLVISGKNALAVALNHARFSDGSIANDYHLQRRGSRFHFWYLGVSSLLYWHLYQTIHPVSLIIFCFSKPYSCAFGFSILIRSSSMSFPLD